jgi:hypothetical protein
MTKSTLSTWIIYAFFLFVPVASSAQEVIHALAGVVISINQKAKTIFLSTDDESDGNFKDLVASKTPLKFDKKLTADAIAADAFTEVGAHVVVLYYGYHEMRTVIALRNMGSGPLTWTDGKVLKYEGKSHTLTIQDTTSNVVSFKVTESTVAETPVGAAKGFKFQIDKGNHVRVTAANVNGDSTALFINVNVM